MGAWGRGPRGPAARIAMVLLAVAALAACGNDEETPQPATTGAGGGGTATTGAGGGGTIDVTLQEYAVIPAQASAPTGSVTFNATNNGNENHELVVIKTDLAADALPTAEDAVDESGEGIEVIGEIEEFPPGETQSATFDLEAGAYVLICNVERHEEGKPESHYKAGMRVAFSVTS